MTVGDRVWVRQPDGRTHEVPRGEGRRERMLHLVALRRDASDLLAEWRSFGVRDDVSDETRFEGRPVTIIGARIADRERPAVWIDPQYGIVRFITRERVPEGTVLIDVGFSDHRPLVGRLFYPYRQEVFANGKLLLRVAVRSVSPNTNPSKDLFDPEILKRRG